MANGRYQAIGFSFFVRKLKSGLTQRLEHFERANRSEQGDATKTPEEWMELYRSWSEENQKSGLNDLIKAFLRDLT